MGSRRVSISLLSRSDTITGVLTLPDAREPVPALVLCHGALGFKENLAELGEYLCSRGIASLALDMHGHGASGGERCHVNIGDWVSDIRCAVDYLRTVQEIRRDAIGAFGFSSGGTAVLEAAVTDCRLRCIITLDATVNNTLGLFDTGIVSILNTLGRIKRMITGTDLRLSMVKAFGKVPAASDPEVDRSWQEDPRVRRMWSSVPFPGFSPSFTVDTIKRVHRIRMPVMVLHGEDDRIDDPESARKLHEALTCPKRLRIIPGNGHMGHRDRNREEVFRLTADWALAHLV
ncbi:MAG TPA: alpha/beta fold hydrolase [Deltaproteobacteria bacterium]|nr:alpha/beta fold hydrolase [Deltaproteobacteria bacterium]HPR55007.1 alpha/beta fold hydrolase [Deltaproteobacteria bacterium]HXK46344.1 alpha/beta fold hydrolase [Deltaproteobacteria bacterium]